MGTSLLLATFCRGKLQGSRDFFLGSKVLCALFSNLHSLPFLPLSLPLKCKFQNKTRTEPSTQEIIWPLYIEWEGTMGPWWVWRIMGHTQSVNYAYLVFILRSFAGFIFLHSSAMSSDVSLPLWQLCFLLCGPDRASTMPLRNSWFRSNSRLLRLVLRGFSSGHFLVINSFLFGITRWIKQTQNATCLTEL